MKPNTDRRNLVLYWAAGSRVEVPDCPPTQTARDQICRHHRRGHDGRRHRDELLPPEASVTISRDTQGNLIGV